MNWIYINYIVISFIGMFIGIVIRGWMLHIQQNKDKNMYKEVDDPTEKYKMPIPEEHISEFWDLYDNFMAAKKGFKYKTKYFLWKKIFKWIPEADIKHVYYICDTAAIHPYIYARLTKDEIADIKAKKKEPKSSPFSEDIAEIMKEQDGVFLEASKAITELLKYHELSSEEIAKVIKDYVEMHSDNLTVESKRKNSKEFNEDDNNSRPDKSYCEGCLNKNKYYEKSGPCEGCKIIITGMCHRSIKGV